MCVLVYVSFIFYIHFFVVQKHTSDASSLAVSLPPLQNEEGVGPLADPQSISQQNLLWSDPHDLGPQSSLLPQNSSSNHAKRDTLLACPSCLHSWATDKSC